MTTHDLQPYRPPAPGRQPSPQKKAAQPGLDVLLSQCLLIGFRHKWKIAVCLLLGLAGAIAVVILTPVVYRSEARLLVRYITERTVSDPSGIGGRVTSPDSRGATIIQSEIGILTSRELIERVVDELGASLLTAQPEEAGDIRSSAILAVQRNLEAQRARDSSIIEVTYDAPTPAQAREVLSHLVDLYLEKHLEVHRTGLDYEFLLQQTDQMAARLAETERELQAARAELGIGDIDVAKENNRMRIDELTNQLFLIDTRLASVRARQDALMRQAGARTDEAVTTPTDREPVPAAADASDMITMLTARLRNLRARELTLLATYAEQSALVQSVRQDIARVEEELRTAVSTLSAQDLSRLSSPATTGDPASAISVRIDHAILDAAMDLASLNAERMVIQQRLDETHQMAVKIEASEAKIRRLLRRREVEETNYLYFSQSLEQARIDDVLDSGKVTNINVVQRPTLPLEGHRHEVRKHAAGALAAGLLAGLGLAFVLEKGIHCRRFVRSVEIPATLGIPVLVSIPYIGRRARRAAARAASESNGGRDGPWRLIEGVGPHCERLYHRILLLHRNADKPLVVGITGCSHGSGVSTIASGLARGIAREGQMRVLLATASLQRGAEVFTNEQGRGTVVDWNRTVEEVQDADSRLPDASAPDRRLQTFLSRLEGGMYGCVVLDLPPVFEQGKELALGAFIDGVVLVVKAESDRRAVARHCVELLKETDVPVFGAVFNQFRQYVPTWLGGDI